MKLIGFNKRNNPCSATIGQVCSSFYLHKCILFLCEAKKQNCIQDGIVFNFLKTSCTSEINR